MSGDETQVRQFNRAITRRIGVLENDYLALGRSLGQARLLYEIDNSDGDLLTLRKRLGLDSGYLSRLLGLLQRQGLVQVSASQDDARRRIATLSTQGHRAKAEYDTVADAFAEQILAPLDRGQRERLFQAMDTVTRLMSAHAVTIAPAGGDEPAVRACVIHYFDELAERFEGDFDAERYTTRSAEADFRPPSGTTRLAWLDDRPVGCASLKTLAAGVGEIKRVWVAREVRGLGVGARLVRALEADAAGLGHSRLRLGTHRALTEAQALYPRLGYRQVAPFDDDPFTHVWFEKVAPFAASPGS